MLLPLGLLGVAIAQTDIQGQPRASLFNTQVPEATILISKHPTGADMVEITMTKKGFPGELLTKDIKELGKYLNSEPRGVQIWDYVLDPSNPNSHFTKATFAVDGVLNRKLESVRLNPFARALAGAPKPWQIHSLSFQLKGESPTSKMIQSYQGNSVLVEGRFEKSPDPNLAGIEYRVELLSQDPAKIDIPEPGDPPIKAKKAKETSDSTDWSIFAIFGIATVALGSLVYSLLLRGRAKPRK